MWLLLACTGDERPDASIEFVAAGAPVYAMRSLVLDPGQFDEAGWVSGPPERASVALPDGTALESDLPVALPIGELVLTVQRPCGAVSVPVRVDPGVPLVSVPHPSCGARLDTVLLPNGHRLDREKWTAGRLRGMQSLGLLLEVPLELQLDDEPARYLTRSEAAAACAFWGGSLPGAHALTTAVGLLPDLAAAPRVWLEPIAADPPAIASTFGATESGDPGPEPAPSSARSESIGFRCAYPPS